MRYVTCFFFSLQDVQHVCHLDLRQSRLPNPKKQQHPKSQSKERRQLRTVMPRLRRRLKPLETPNEELFEVVIILCTW
ncbi:uncharacterized protein LOC118364306 isoform X1 [Oncorhynchus keta]|uniref:uncharacterized protein LOC118364306 isoform X1 n=1 Tax=Oncorhynchus keta TaxID=8018 RepID=UPI00227B6E6B|nr:uncharacterized protein LOC118364306 isoform X1 [Oncorhynchus keta]